MIPSNSCGPVAPVDSAAAKAAGHDDRTGMHNCLVKQIVELKAMRRGAVAKRGSRRGKRLLASHDTALAARTFGQHLFGHDHCPRLPRTEERATQRVEQAPFRTVDYRCRQGFRRERVNERDQILGGAAGWKGFRVHPSTNARQKRREAAANPVWLPML